MNQGKRVKPVTPIEYRLLITPRRNEIEKKNVTLVALRTVVEFANFRYEIIVDPGITNRIIHFTIRGIRAPQVSLPGSGPAVFKKEYDDLRGLYNIVVSKHGKIDNSFSVNITESTVKLKKSPINKFVEIVTNQFEW